MRLCISGGDKVPHQLQEEFRRAAGFGIDECFGMREIGRDDGTEVAPGEQGRLWIQAPSRMLGYWDNPDATADTIRQGWLDTGDEMRVDADGYVWFCGRRKQILVHDSSTICPQEVEEALLEHPAVDLVGVIGIQDPVRGENVRASMTLRPDQPAPSEAERIACPSPLSPGWRFSTGATVASRPVIGAARPGPRRPPPRDPADRLTQSTLAYAQRKT